jgi:PPP family 3-phenylpropionic acid transporter
MGALLPYLSLVLAARGLDASQMSWIMVVMPLCNLFIPPLWGTLADAFDARLPLLRLASLGCSGAALLLLPHWGPGGSTFALGLLSFFRAPMISLTDATTYQQLGGPRVDFSKIRVWGSIGFAFFCLLLGLLKGSERSGLLITATSGIYFLSFLSTLPLRLDRQRGPYRQTTRQDLLRETLAILSRPPMALFLLATVFYYFGQSSYDGYFGLYAKSLGFDDTFVGLAWGLAVGAEISLMLLAPSFIHRWPSTMLLIICSMVAVLRWAALSLLSSFVPLLAAQLLHGVTFGLWYLSMVKFVQGRAPDALRTSLQSVALSCMGLGMVIGFFFGGQILFYYGGRWLFGLASIISLGALMLYGASIGCERRHVTDG